MFHSLRSAPALILLSLLTACTVQQADRRDDAPPFLSLLTSSSSSSPSSSPARTQDARALMRRGTVLGMGSMNAPALLLFTNHACAYCRRFQEEILPRLKEDFIDAGKVELRTAILPLEKYPLSRREAAALPCAGAQGKGQEMHAALFRLDDHTEENLLAAAQALQLKMEDFSACLASPDTAALAQAQEDLAAQLDVTLIPALFLGEERWTGLPRYADLRGWVESGLDD
ncbi:MAG: thioredoxin domain-containing protein [Patescibacteria group bacterium]